VIYDIDGNSMATRKPADGHDAQHLIIMILIIRHYGSWSIVGHRDSVNDMVWTGTDCGTGSYLTKYDMNPAPAWRLVRYSSTSNLRRHVQVPPHGRAMYL